MIQFLRGGNYSMKQKSYYEYLNFNNANLFTIICLPEINKKFPVVIFRCPYVDNTINQTEEEVIEFIEQFAKCYLDNGYAVIYQHCRGTGKSSGDCIPYINEREDGLFLQEWIRKQSFYNGELFLVGGSYLSSVHLLTYPFASDIKGAVLEIQDSNRYNCNYRNGFYKISLHGNWYVSMYKKKSLLNKNFNDDSYKMLPLIDFSKKVFNESVEDFDKTLLSPDKNDVFWDSKLGGIDTKNALINANIPILLTTGFYDIYTGGIFYMWNSLDKNTKSKSALVVHAYDHDGSSYNQDIVFENGTIYEQFGTYQVKWLNYIKGKQECPFELNKVNYYRLFENKWAYEDFKNGNKSKKIKLGDKSISYVYDPLNPASFKGGLSCNFGGAKYQEKPNIRKDIITIYTKPFSKDTFIKGKMKAKLNVSSSCEDTCFYMRISLKTEQGDYGLRDDINKISNFNNNYKVNDKIDIEFNFDEHAFLVKKGQSLRIDISSSAYPLYVSHTNQKGLFCLIKESKKALNTVNLSDSYLIVYYE